MGTRVLLLTVGLVLLAGPATAPARHVERWEYDRLFKEADLVIIAKPEATKSTADDFGKHPWPVEMVGQETTFAAARVLKGDPGKDAVRVLYFKFGEPKKGAGQAAVIRNGPQFATFRTRDVDVVTAGHARTRLTLPAPEYLLFLKKRADGRYEAVSGQWDSALSVREVIPPREDLADK